MRARVLIFALLLTYGVTVLTACSGSEGYQIYRANCSGCHDTGRSNTPTLVDNVYWISRESVPLEERIAKTIAGDETGKWGIQPPRGGNPKLTDLEVQMAIEWMLVQVEKEK